MILFKKIYLDTRGFFLWLISFLVNSTVRASYPGRKENADPLEKNKQPFIFALFHHSYFHAFYSYKNKNLCTLIADNEDGETLSTYAKLYGYRPIRIPAEENSPKAARAAIQMVKALKADPKGVIAVDGPYGPFEKVKPGIFLIAQKTGAKIIPVAIAAKRFITIKKRWDKYRIPLPFTKVIACIDKPLDVPKELTKEKIDELALKLENRIKELDKETAALIKSKPSPRYT